MPKYTDEQIAELEGFASMGRLYQKIVTNKDTRNAVVKAVKQVDPGWAFPDDGERTREDVLAAVNDRLDKEREERETREMEQRLVAQKRGLLDGSLLPGRVFDEAQVKEIEEKVMPRYGLADYEAAAKIYAADLPAPVPGHDNAMPGDRWELPDYAGLQDDPAKAANQMAKKVIDEFRSPRRR